MYKVLLATTSILGASFIKPVYAYETIKIGVLATVEGAYTVLGEDALRGVKTALNNVDGKIGNKKIELVIQSVNTTPNSVVTAAQKLLDQNVNIIIGPTSSEQGIAIRDFSQTKNQATFINGISGAVQTTYVNPSKNFFRFNTDNAQWSVGLGEYVYNHKKYESVSIVANDYAFNHAQVLGFVNEYCALGGEVLDRYWLPLGEKKYANIIEKISEDADAIYLGLSGSDALQFLKQYNATGGKAKFIGSSITVDGALLNAPENIKQKIVGMPSSGPQSETWGDENWQSFLKGYKKSFPAHERFVAPSILATGYHNATKAALTCLEEVDGDLSQGHTKFRQCLSALELKAPNGTIKLDDNRQAIANNFVTEVIEQDDGTLVKKLVRIRQDVNQVLGLSKEAYDAIGLPNRSGPVCQN